MSEDAATALHAIVHGRVQGVGFRFFVQRQADAHGLNGWVRNLAGGSVEVLAEGPQRSLDALLGDLRSGPRMAIVERVESEWRAAQGLRGFEITG